MIGSNGEVIERNARDEGSCAGLRAREGAKTRARVLRIEGKDGVQSKSRSPGNPPVPFKWSRACGRARSRIRDRLPKRVEYEGEGRLYARLPDRAGRKERVPFDYKA